MNEQVNIPPAPRAGGCCGMGCLTLVALLVFLAFAFVGGAFWAMKHLRQKYSASEPISMPEALTSDAPASVEGSAIEGSPPQPNPAPLQAREAETRWKAFEKATDRQEKARIELTAGEINALLQNHRNTRGKAFVWIENNVGRVRVSIPLKDVPLMKGRYLNGEATVEASPDGDPNKLRISNVVLANSSVSDRVMDQRFFGLSSMRSAMGDWLNEQNITSLRVENNRAIIETRGE